MFTCIRGWLRCVRCGAEADQLFQTYLFRTDASNASYEHRVGDCAIIDQPIEDFYPLYPWDHGSLLTLGLGDWDCDRCSLNWQWAKVVVAVEPCPEGLRGTIKAVETLVPWEPVSLAGIHYVEPDLARLGDFDKPSSERSWQALQDAWLARPVAERCISVSAGFRAWCLEVAGITAPA